MIKILSAASIIALMAFTSCQKEISGSILALPVSTPLLGTWKFMNSRVFSTSTSEITDQFSNVKTITVSDYTTTNNQGFLVIDDTAVTTNSVSYDVSAVATAYTYQDGNLADSSDFPFSFSVPPTSSVSPYKLIGTDSVSAPNGSLTQVQGAASIQSAPGGYKYKITGDSLILTATINQSLVDTSFGVPITTTDRATVVSTLSRK